MPAIPTGDGRYVIAFERAGNPRNARSNVLGLLDESGLTAPPVAGDILNLATAVYGADIAVPRKTAEDDWGRKFVVHLPVANRAAWTKVNPTVSTMLGFLTGDDWQLRLRTAGTIAQGRQPSSRQGSLLRPPSAVSLFSGGLDSFVGAIDRLDQDEVIALVGHHGAGSTNKAQERAYNAVHVALPGRTVFFPFYVQPPSGEGEPEKTTRSRSILFLAIGTAVARALGEGTPLVVPENGLISINVPLTHARSGSLSTRTTHPYFLALYREVLEGLGIPVDVQMPYRFLTKGEMLRRVLKRPAFRAGVHDTVSCSHPDVGRYNKHSPGQHCGYCVPCLIRRAALAAVNLDDPRRYLMDVLTQRPLARTQTGRDLRAFEIAIARFASADHRQLVSDVLSSGPLPPGDVPQYVAVYERGIKEIRKLLGRAKIQA